MNPTYKIGDRVRITPLCFFTSWHGRIADVVDAHDEENIRVRFSNGEQLTLMSRSLELVGIHPIVPPKMPSIPLLPEDSAERKTIPLFSVLFGYFPAAMVALTKHSYASNEKHNPGEELHWSRAKSDDHADAALRHLVEGDHVGLLWRAAALLQMQLEGEGYPKAPLAK